MCTKPGYSCCLAACFFLLVQACPAQHITDATAVFLFNNRSDRDEVSKRKAELVGVAYTEDRFGNTNSAIFLSGNPYSYLNLGTNKVLKSKTGSISLWLKVETLIWAGQGFYSNPILLTKRDSVDDYFEAYGMFLELYTKKLCVTLSKDSIEQINHYSAEPIELNKWYHLVLTYDNNYSAFYLNGELQGKFPKRFHTIFLEGDSVLVGSCGNKKNERFLKGDVDDILFYDRALLPAEISALYHAPNPNQHKILLVRVLAFLALAFLAGLVYLLVKFQVRKAVLKEKQRLELHNRLLKTELRVNRASMNPHFLFNSLNTLHNFILNNEAEHASDYLVKFSKLIRKTLESNMYDFILLEQEIELLERYLEIEKMRFEENITCSIITDSALVVSSVHIPLMMIQPFVENAIWHGLLNKPGEKTIAISFALHNTHYIYCVIEDNGLGRRKTGANTGKRPLATSFVIQRLELLNKIHRLSCSLVIEDKPNGQGTIVKLILPILNK